MQLGKSNASNGSSHGKTIHMRGNGSLSLASSSFNLVLVLLAVIILLCLLNFYGIRTINLNNKEHIDLLINAVQLPHDDGSFIDERPRVWILGKRVSMQMRLNLINLINHFVNLAWEWLLKTCVWCFWETWLSNCQWIKRKLGCSLVSWLSICSVNTKPWSRRSSKSKSNIQIKFWSFDSNKNQIKLQVNHFPGSGFITNKVSLATSNLKHIPKAFHLPKEKEKFLKHVSFKTKQFIKLWLNWLLFFLSG